MWRIRRSIQAILTAILLVSLLTVHLTPIRADAADFPSLTISQLKITSSNGQFITLYNATDTALDMSKYQLQYFNNYDLSKATSSKLIALSGIVPPHGYLMVNDGALLLCYQLTINSVSLGLSSTAGMIEILAFDQSNPGGPVSPVLQDYVSWSKTAAPGAQALPSNVNAFLQRQPTDPRGNPLIAVPGAGGWLGVQPDGINPCDLVGTGSGSLPVQPGPDQLLPPTEPPVTIADTAAGSAGAGASTPTMPAADIGLMAPVVNELLPNPSGTGNDSTDEFVELYNPNNAPFDLSGFSLQSGTASLRTFAFPAGTMLPPQSFTAFYAKTTSLSLSNTSGQVKLLDPFGNSISTSGPYAAANDGQAWALAKGKWYWTTSPTPNKANAIHQPPAKKSTKTTASKSKTSKITAAKAKGSKSTPNDTGSDGEPIDNPIHTRTLALVVGAALLYGAYEYRTDMANRIYQLRRHFGGRHADGT
ncbi:MAG TPA: lamin tail domain-containing protein [Candidatus Saccharimonadales bacterium]|nr:lamin tail domain-containing protein [Candidatus Saccharimonadales bacterium]